jgi:hypothetical protein
MYVRMHACICVCTYVSSNDESLTAYVPFNGRTLKYMSSTRTFRRLKNKKTFYKIKISNICSYLS